LAKSGHQGESKRRTGGEPGKKKREKNLSARRGEQRGRGDEDPQDIRLAGKGA